MLEQSKQDMEGVYDDAAISVHDLQGINTGFIYQYDFNYVMARPYLNWNDPNSLT